MLRYAKKIKAHAHLVTSSVGYINVMNINN